MSPKSHKGSSLYIQKMIEACEKIREYAGNTNESNFASQKESYDAICMQFSQLGEQVNHLEKSSDRIIQHFPDEVPWSALKAIRNRIGHNYTSVDAGIIWKFATENIEPIEQSLKRILKKRYGV
jgi:uncharacterized protein with HEPN domain